MFTRRAPCSMDGSPPQAGWLFRGAAAGLQAPPKPPVPPPPPAAVYPRTVQPPSGVYEPEEFQPWAPAASGAGAGEPPARRPADDDAAPGDGGPPLHPLPQLPPQAPVPEGLRKRKLCIFFEAGTCRRATDCYFAHGPEELTTGSLDADYAKRPKTARMDFSGLDIGKAMREVKVPGDQTHACMTDRAREILLEVTGVDEVRWERDRSTAVIVGGMAQLDKASRVLQRAMEHCKWGISESKFCGVMKPRLDLRSARIRLSPMVPALKEVCFSLSIEKTQMTIGSDAANAVKVRGPTISRTHAAIEFDQTRGGVYVVDCSTNGTFLNGRRLPPKASAKVLLSHGDELLLQDPRTMEGREFGYITNIELS